MNAVYRKSELAFRSGDTSRRSRRAPPGRGRCVEHTNAMPPPSQVGGTGCDGATDLSLPTIRRQDRWIFSNLISRIDMLESIDHGRFGLS